MVCSSFRHLMLWDKFMRASNARQLRQIRERVTYFDHSVRAVHRFIMAMSLRFTWHYVPPACKIWAWLHATSRNMSQARNGLSVVKTAKTGYVCPSCRIKASRLHLTARPTANSPPIPKVSKLVILRTSDNAKSLNSDSIGREEDGRASSKSIVQSPRAHGQKQAKLRWTERHMKSRHARGRMSGYVERILFTPTPYHARSRPVSTLAHRVVPTQLPQTASCMREAVVTWARPKQKSPCSSLPVAAFASVSNHNPLTGLRQFSAGRRSPYHGNLPRSGMAQPVTVSDSALEPTLMNAVRGSQGIRDHLREWQALHGHESLGPEVVFGTDIADPNEPINEFSRLPEPIQSTHIQDPADDSDDRIVNSTQDSADWNSEVNMRSLNMGDLVEITFAQGLGTRQRFLAVFIRAAGDTPSDGQYLSMFGHLVHTSLSRVPISFPGWAGKELIEPLMPYLPDVADLSNLVRLKEKAAFEDVDIPRSVSGPLVQRLQDFNRKTEEIYRRCASRLDNAHEYLAHDTDLRYGSLTSAARVLLGIKDDEIPQPALFVVRRALAAIPFGFEFDRNSHRVTGYVQIRSKQQVQGVNAVRTWVRQYQESVASAANSNSSLIKEHLMSDTSSSGAAKVSSFIAKARTIVLKSRQSRKPTEIGQIGPSKIQIPITRNQNAMKVTTEVCFNADDEKIIRFLEAWSLSALFKASSLAAVPPIIIHATGLYPYDSIKHEIGFLFLQELGTISPYENRAKYDPHLLLPSSQHSKPLEQLLSYLSDMGEKKSHGFKDSMAHLRHDWHDLPVYCIDQGNALEIDDGLSIEPAGFGPDGKRHYWIHTHIANPTAFFDRHHPLSQMARHMGESIYMPERAYVMLPRWASQSHFSLAPDRPCLTFSAKLDEDGNKLDQAIRSGQVRNVFKLTPEEVQVLLRGKDISPNESGTITVGGDIPPPPPRKSYMDMMNPSHIDDLKILYKLAVGRTALRRAAGGVFYDMGPPTAQVYSRYGRPGLPWDNPFRQGGRITEGDPVIQVSYRPFRNWFKPLQNPAEQLVREMMLLACEVASSWCADREIPIIHRGTIPNPVKGDAEAYYRETVEPLLDEDGAMPMGAGSEYLTRIGFSACRTTAFKHKFLGLQNYSRVTSPLRRYSDMIAHWQIEAALRREATTNKSLVVDTSPKARSSRSNQSLDRSFLPFSEKALNTIMVGLVPREQRVAQVNRRADHFWVHMLLFRKHFFPELSGGPITDHFPTLHCVVGREYGTLRGIEQGLNREFIRATLMEMSLACRLLKTDLTSFEPGQSPHFLEGDVWQVEMSGVAMSSEFHIDIKPVKLVERNGVKV